MVARVKPYLHWLILFPALLFGILLYTSLAPIGLGVSTDGVNYLFTAQNLAEGRGYISYDNTPLTWWPPLYPSLLAGIHLLTGAGLLSIAFWFNVATFIGLVVATLLLARQLFPNRPLLVFWSTLMAAGTPVLVAAAQNAGTDYLAALLVVCAFLAAEKYIRKPSWNAWLWLLIIGVLSSLNRYIGVTVVALAGMVVFFYTPGTWIRKVRFALGQGAGLVPLVFWGWRNIQTGTGPFGPRVPAYNSLLTNASLTYEVFLRWIFPDQMVIDHHLRTSLTFDWMVFLLVVLLAIGFWMGSRRKQVLLPKVAVPVIIFSLMYPMALILNASVTYFKDITDRFLVPVYLPVFLTGLLGIEVLVRLLLARLARPIALTGCIVALAVLPTLTNWNGIAETSHLIAASHGAGVEPDNLYINREWQTNETLDLVRTLINTQNQAVFYSNRPAGVALYTGHTVFWSPAKFDPVFESHTYALGNYASAFKQCSSQCYLVWMLPHPYVHLYLPSQLSRIVRLEKVYYSPTGIIYRILPPG